MIAYKKLHLLEAMNGRGIYGFSPTQFAIWRPDETGLPCLELIEDALRAADSTRGIYALNSSLSHQLLQYDGDVVALWLSGYVVEYAYGFRASRARVTEVLTTDRNPTPIGLDKIERLLTQMPVDIANDDVFKELTSRRQWLLEAQDVKRIAELFETLDCWIKDTAFRGHARESVEAGIDRWIREHSLGPFSVNYLNAQTAMKASERYSSIYVTSHIPLVVYVLERVTAFAGDIKSTNTFLTFLVKARKLCFDILPPPLEDHVSRTLHTYIESTSSAHLRSLWLVAFGLRSRNFIMFLHRCKVVDAVLLVAKTYGRMLWTDEALARMPEITYTQLSEYAQLPQPDTNTAHDLKVVGMS